MHQQIQQPDQIPEFLATSALIRSEAAADPPTRNQEPPAKEVTPKLTGSDVAP